MTKHIASLAKRYKRQFPKLTEKQAEKLARAALIGKGWGIRHGLQLGK